MIGTGRSGCGVFALAGLMWLGTGCLGDGMLAESHETLAREHRDRMERLERIEARLLGAEALRAGWTELRTRHGRVTELACANMSEHAVAIVKHEEKERGKRQASRNRRVAAAGPPAGGSAPVMASDLPPRAEQAHDEPAEH